MGRTFDRAVSTPSMDAVIANNIALNGGMEVSQENGTTQTTLTNNVIKYTVDQFTANYNHTAATAVLKFQQVAPPGSPAFGAAFQNCLQLTATTLSAMAGAGDFANIIQPIEGYRWAKLGFGNTTNPQYVTIGFWVYATIAGTMNVSLRNSATNRSYVTNVVVNSATTWEYKTVTILADTSGTWLTTSGVGVYLGFCFGAGSTFQGTNNAWQATNVFATSSTTNFFASTNNTVCITGVCVWPGTDAPTAARSPLAKRSFDEELTLLRRYYYVLNYLGNAENIGLCVSYAGASGVCPIRFPVPMRAQPTFNYSNTSHFLVLTNATNGAPTAIGTDVAGSEIYSVLFTFTMTQGWAGYVRTISTSARLYFDSRL